MRRAKALIRFMAVILGVGVASAALWKGLMGPRPPAIEEGDFGAVGNFRLTERSGRAFSRTDLLGKVWVADFIFTRCMGPCPRLSKAMAGLQDEFTQDPSVGFLSFSVDPAHDTPAVLSDYADRFGADPARWLFLTGDTAAVRDLVVGSFKAALRDNPGAPAGESVTHSLHFVLVDKTGRIRGYFTGTDQDSLARLRRRVRTLL